MAIGEAVLADIIIACNYYTFVGPTKLTHIGTGVKFIRTPLDPLLLGALITRLSAGIPLSQTRLHLLQFGVEYVSYYNYKD